ncbi:discoidin domain-containing protein [[Mycoplasma] testudinis]|uniref:discoidin domain-containing protein n=1 Tax=[Mycoplasma] testudinis TaxID=33924 RepID=UPI000489D5B6|nr:discoidin domain-containing protein [[Mycoplasma] testudinis]
MSANVVVSTANQNVFSDEVKLGDTLSFSDLNNILATTLPSVPDTLASNGFSLSFTKGIADREKGTLTINALLSRNNQNFDANGNVTDDKTGITLTLSGFRIPATATAVTASNILVPNGWSVFFNDSTNPGSTRDVGVLNNTDAGSYVFYSPNGGASGYDAGNFFGINMGSLRSLEKINFYNGSTRTTTDFWHDFKVDTSTDGSNWTTNKNISISENPTTTIIDKDFVIHATAPGNMVINFTSPINAQYVRIVATVGHRNWVQIATFQVFSAPIRN